MVRVALFVQIEKSLMVLMIFNRRILRLLKKLMVGTLKQWHSGVRKAWVGSARWAIAMYLRFRTELLDEAVRNVVASKLRSDSMIWPPVILRLLKKLMVGTLKQWHSGVVKAWVGSARLVINGPWLFRLAQVKSKAAQFVLANKSLQDLTIYWSWIQS